MVFRKKWDLGVPLLFGIAIASGALHFFEAPKVIYFLVYLFLFVGVVFSPGLILLGLFPLVFSIHPFPQEITHQEVLYAFLVVALLASFFLKKQLSGVFLSLIKKNLVTVGLAVSFIILNFVISIVNSVPFLDWFRGVVPFLFISLAFLFATSLKVGIISTKDLVLSGLLTSALFSADVLFVFFGDSLWQPKWSYVVDGVEYLANQAFVESTSYDFEGPLYFRVTLFVPRSTDAFLPFGVVISFLASLFLSFKSQRALATTNLLVLCAAIYAVFSTYTRSMILSFLVVLLFIFPFIFIYERHLVRRYLINLGIVVLISVSFLYYFQPNGVILGRFSSLFNSTKQIALSSGSVTAPLEQDVNVSARAEEYKIAYRMFLDSPIWGNGFGIKHEIGSEDREGKPIKIFVSYIHNWPLYFLMIGGVLGFAVYVFPIFYSGTFVLSSLRQNFKESLFLGSSLTLVFLYALFFAVFRSVAFNLLLASIYGYVLSKKIKLESE